MGSANKSGVGIKLKELVKEVNILNATDIANNKITSLTADSRQVVPGTLFVAVAGLTVDGHDYVQDAVSRGCAAVLVDKGFCRGLGLEKKISCLETTDTKAVLGKVAAAFWQKPAQKMVMIGITGTNGKTTSTYLLESIVRSNGGNPGVIGTVN